MHCHDSCSLSANTPCQCSRPAKREAVRSFRCTLCSLCVDAQLSLNTGIACRHNGYVSPTWT